MLNTWVKFVMAFVLESTPIMYPYLDEHNVFSLLSDWRTYNNYLMHGVLLYLTKNVYFVFILFDFTIFFFFMYIFINQTDNLQSVQFNYILICKCAVKVNKINMYLCLRERPIGNWPQGHGGRRCIYIYMHKEYTF